MNLSKGYFVTGTDTEIGKTLVSAALLWKLNSLGIDCVGFKPVVAGTYIAQNGARLNEDIESLRMVSTSKVERSLSADDLCPYILDAPIAPHLGAASQNIALDAKTILSAFKQLQRDFSAVIVEGVGGFLVPINDVDNMGDVAQSFDLPVILVVGMRLGCINHALLSCEAIAQRKLKLAGWVANSLNTPMPMLQENVDALKKRIPAPFLGLIPSLSQHLAKPQNTPYSIEALTFAAEHLNLELL